MIADLTTDGLWDQTSDILAPLAGVNYIGTVLFLMTMYNAVAHLCVLFELRMLPKRDLLRLRLYYVFEVCSVAFCAIYTWKFIWMAVIHNLQHFYFFYTWNEAEYCKKVLHWYTLDRVKETKASQKQKSSLDILLGTVFDLAVHIVFACCVFNYLRGFEVFLAAVLLFIMLRLVLFNQKYAWSNPSSVPDWVEKRLN